MSDDDQQRVEFITARTKKNPRLVLTGDMDFLLALVAKQAEALKAVEALVVATPGRHADAPCTDACVERILHELQLALASADHRDGGEK